MNYVVTRFYKHSATDKQHLQQYVRLDRFDMITVVQNRDVASTFDDFERANTYRIKADQHGPVIHGTAWYVTWDGIS